MLKSNARLLGALILGAALALPLAAAAQGAGGAAPTTAPTKEAGKVPQAPQVAAPAATSPPVAAKGSTAVPGWNNPPAWGAASERPQFATIPGVDTNRLIQGAGREWRAFRNGPLTQFGGWLVVGALAIVILIYLVKGSAKLHSAPTGRLIERFNAVERASHWVMAISFVLLAITGIVILFGKHIILPWLGYTAFSWLTVLSKNLHNFVGPLFIFSLVVMFLLYVRDNFFRSYDWKWFGGITKAFTKDEVPSGRFNAGEKAWFWGGVILLSIV
ncbi:MAG TPA: cytochrome b/b6 domain-containing protein, partial [Chloroflexota bacterium]|nr:cytochrome b/b6 domain-containing protein [Chloroflexota bacterium]